MQKSLDGIYRKYINTASIQYVNPPKIKRAYLYCTCFRVLPDGTVLTQHKSKCWCFLCHCLQTCQNANVSVTDLLLIKTVISVTHILFTQRQQKIDSQEMMQHCCWAELSFSYIKVLIRTRLPPYICDQWEWIKRTGLKIWFTDSVNPTEVLSLMSVKLIK